MPYEDDPFNGDVIVEYEFLKLKSKFNIKTVIETGSCLFSTTKWLGENFNKIYTYEINETFYQYGLSIVKHLNNISAVLGNSVEHLPYLKNIVDNNTIFFLDSHWGDYCPLLDELNIISTFNIEPVIVIHDFKTNNSEFGYDSYGDFEFNYENIKNSLDKIYKNGYDYYYNTNAVGAKRGLIYITPKIVM